MVFNGNLITLLITLNGNFTFIMPHFRVNDVFLRAEIVVRAIYPLGGVIHIFDDGSRKGDHEFLFVFYGNFTSIMHHFRENDVFLQTGIDVMVLSSLGGAVQSFP